MEKPAQQTKGTARMVRKLMLELPDEADVLAVVRDDRMCCGTGIRRKSLGPWIQLLT